MNQDEMVMGRIPAIETLKSDRDINKVFLQEDFRAANEERFRVKQKKKN